MLDVSELATYINSVDLIDAAIYAITMLIPIGRVTSYSTIARILGLHPRRVAQSLKRNRIPIAIPCHRVVMSNGELGGYSYGGERVKRKLLEVEGVKIENGRIPKMHFYCQELLELLGIRR